MCGARATPDRPPAPERLEIRTSTRTVVVPIGARVRESLAAYGDFDGAALIRVPHTTCGLAVNEPEPGVLRDIEAWLERAVPWEGAYAHNQGGERNAAAHLRALLVGSQVIVPVARGQLELGAWQDVLLVECDGPRTRRVEIRPLNLTGGLFRI